MNNTIFVVDTYDKYLREDRDTARFIFLFNEQWYAIKEYEVRDGELMRELRFYENENENNLLWRYDTYDEAREFVRNVCGL